MPRDERVRMNRTMFLTGVEVHSPRRNQGRIGRMGFEGVRVVLVAADDGLPVGAGAKEEDGGLGIMAEVDVTGLATRLP